MRSCLALVLVAASMVLPRSASASPPPGSYQQTCRDIQVSGDTLQALCRTRDGRWVWSSLAAPDTCTEIANIDGQLTCSRWRTSRGNPPGSYQLTCRDIQVQGDVLRALCRTRDGRWTWSAFADVDRCSDIANIDGQLRCDRPRGPSGPSKPPEGFNR
jgi:hypothetical protein